MRAAAVCLALCLGSVSAYADPVGVELAGTWSGKTNEPKNGWRAALLVPVEGATVSREGTDTLTRVAFVARFDDHGAPAESGTAETHARSFGAGFRGTVTWGSAWQLGMFGEGTIGRTRARHADVMTSHSDWHWMVSGGFTGGTRTVQLVADFGWLTTGVGDGRIGPIASLGVHVALD